MLRNGHWIDLNDDARLGQYIMFRKIVTEDQTKYNSSGSYQVETFKIVGLFKIMK